MEWPPCLIINFTENCLKTLLLLLEGERHLITTQLKLCISVRLNDAPPPSIKPNIHILIPGTSVYVILHDKKGFASMIKLRILILVTAIRQEK